MSEEERLAEKSNETQEGKRSMAAYNADLECQRFHHEMFSPWGVVVMEPCQMESDEPVPGGTESGGVEEGVGLMARLFWYGAVCLFTLCVNLVAWPALAILVAGNDGTPTLVSVLLFVLAVGFFAAATLVWSITMFVWSMFVAIGKIVCAELGCGESKGKSEFR